MEQAMDQALSRLQKSAVCHWKERVKLTCAIIWHSICSSVSHDGILRLAVRIIHLGWQMFVEGGWSLARFELG